MRHQPKLKGIKRVPTSASVHPKIEQAVTYVAKRYKVSKSWVRTVAIASFFDIDIPRYDDK